MSFKARAYTFFEWAEEKTWRVVAVVVTFAVVLTTIITGPIIWAQTVHENDLSARCEAHGWSLKTVRSGAFCVREDGVIVEVPER